MKLKSFSEPNEQRKLPFWGLHLQWGSISTSMQVLKVQEPRCHSIPYNAIMQISFVMHDYRVCSLKEKVRSFQNVGICWVDATNQQTLDWFLILLEKSSAGAKFFLCSLHSLDLRWFPFNAHGLESSNAGNPKKKLFFASSPCQQYPLSIHHWTCTYPSLTPMAPAFLGSVWIWSTGPRAQGPTGPRAHGPRALRAQKGMGPRTRGAQVQG